MRNLQFDDFSVTQSFDEVIDVRSPSEFRDDHIPGAINLPVLNDAERAIVGTVHKETGEFEARKQGAAMISANIGAYLKTHFASLPKSYSALIYCWRGGQRSRSMATILSAVGWRADLVASGYKGYRTFVRETLSNACDSILPIILNGLTGSGKTLLLRRMARDDRFQVLDLEALANHRGSLLGDEVLVDDARQPTQKGFESRLLWDINQLDLTRPIFVESESKRIGSVSCPESLWKKMVGAPVALLNVPLRERARHLVDAYGHFIDHPNQLTEKLPTLKRIHGASQVSQWVAMTENTNWDGLAESLLEVHYDPSYRRCNNYAKPAIHVGLESLTDHHKIDKVIAQFATFADTSYPPSKVALAR